MAKPIVRTLDIETSLMTYDGFGTGERYMGHQDIIDDMVVWAFAIKTHGPGGEMIYFDQRKRRNKYDDKWIVKKVWRVLMKTDVLVGKNIKRFDWPVLVARFVYYELDIPNVIIRDVEQVARKHLKLSSYSLEYLSKVYNRKYKKLKHEKFPGKELWRECRKGNMEAWDEMEKYNKHDVLATEELNDIFLKLGFNGPSLQVFNPKAEFGCPNGHNEYHRRGYSIKNGGIFRRYKCKVCGIPFQETGEKSNLLSKDKRRSLKRPT